MNAFALSLELARQQSRTRKTAVFSLLIHALLILWLILHRTLAPEPEVLTEITWVEPEPIRPVVAAAASSIEPSRPVRRFPPTPKQEPEHFVRKTEISDFAPRPQMVRAAKDRLQSKLVTLERTTQRDRPKIASLATSRVSDRPSLAAVPDRTVSASGSIALDRSENPNVSTVQLARSEKSPARSSVRLGTIPEKSVTPATVARADSTARRMIDGMSLVGPVADRMLVSYGRPGYPDWAKREGIEGVVDLYFIVLPNGNVKENILVQRTSGFEDFDRNAIDALVAWKFEPLSGGRTGEQWGAITFDYRLSD